MRRLGGDADRTAVVFITVDPERDTPQSGRARRGRRRTVAAQRDEISVAIRTGSGLTLSAAMPSLSRCAVQAV